MRTLSVSLVASAVLLVPAYGMGAGGKVTRFDGYALVSHPRQYKPVKMHSVRSLVPVPEHRVNEFYSPDLKIKRSSGTPLSSPGFDTQAHSARRKDAERQRHGIFSELLQEVDPANDSMGGGQDDALGDGFGAGDGWLEEEPDSTDARRSDLVSPEDDFGLDSAFSELGGNDGLINGEFGRTGSPWHDPRAEQALLDGEEAAVGFGGSGLFGTDRTRSVDRFLDSRGAAGRDSLPGFSSSFGTEERRGIGRAASSSPGFPGLIGGSSLSGDNRIRGGLSTSGSSSLFPDRGTSAGGLGRSGPGSLTGSDNFLVPGRGSVQDMRPSRTILDRDD